MRPAPSHRLKYGDRLDLARALGTMMVRAGAELLREADVIVPVPLHRFRLWRRRFNQAMALGRVAAGASGLPCDPFERTKRTTSQVGPPGRKGGRTCREPSGCLPKRGRG